MGLFYLSATSLLLITKKNPFDYHLLIYLSLLDFSHNLLQYLYPLMWCVWNITLTESSFASRCFSYIKIHYVALSLFYLSIVTLLLILKILVEFGLPYECGLFVNFIPIFYIKFALIKFSNFFILFYSIADISNSYDTSVLVRGGKYIRTSYVIISPCLKSYILKKRLHCLLV